MEEIVENGKTVYRPHSSPNGIVPTLKSFFGEMDRGSWIAWTQVKPRQQERFERIVRVSDSVGEYNVSRLPLTPQQVKSFYHVTSKEALWPILHSFPETYDYEPVDWPTYREVNWRFAEAAAEEAEDDALVWVHDYNLWLVPAYLRQLKPNARIAFFHHTPFPAADVFNILPWRAEIMESLLECDLVGFHIPRYAANFVSAARTLFDIEIEETTKTEAGMSPIGMALSEPTVPTRIRHRGRPVNIDAFPVGTNADYIEALSAKPETDEKVAEIRNALDGRRLIVSVGRTDYTKGTREMLATYERLLERRPELRDKITLMVTSVSSNPNMAVYRKQQRAIEALVGRINGRYGNLGWQPIILFTTAVPFEELIAYYRAADVCWIAPLRDGLNLVAKEFCATRDDDRGVLVLSEFTGAAVELPNAVLTNPYSDRSMDAAIDQALDMDVQEQAARMKLLRDSVRHYDIAHWSRHVIDRFDEIEPRNSASFSMVAE
jgi:glucosylglycerol-phosphate synthase